MVTTLYFVGTPWSVPQARNQRNGEKFYNVGVVNEWELNKKGNSDYCNNAVSKLAPEFSKGQERSSSPVLQHNIVVWHSQHVSLSSEATHIVNIFSHYFCAV